MKKILFILSLFICFISKGQSTLPPTTGAGSVPSSKTAWYQGDYIQGMVIPASRDTNFIPRFKGTSVYWEHAGVDSAWWYWDAVKWNKMGAGNGGTQGFQDVLTIDPDLTSDNAVDGGGHAFEWVNNSAYRIQVNTGGSAGSTVQLVPGGVSISSSDGVNSSNIATSEDGGILLTSSTGAYFLGNAPLPYTSGGFQNLVYNQTTGSLELNSSGSPIPDDGVTYQFQDSTNTPPVSFPVGFDTLYYMVGGAGTGIFSGHNYEIAVYVNEVFDSFIVPDVNDWGLTLDDNIWHQYDGSTWPRRNAPVWNTTGNRGGGVLGSIDNTNVLFKRNNTNLMIFQGGAVVRFPQLTGASMGIMGLNTLGNTSNVQIGSGLLLSGGVLSSTVSGGITTADNGLTANTATNVRLGGSLIQNTTIDGAFTLNLNMSRRITNAADSILDASTKHSIAATDSANVRAAVIYDKAARSFFGASTLNYWGVDSLGFRAQNGFVYGLGFNTYSTSTAAFKPLQQDTTTGAFIRKLIDVSNNTAQITGTLAVANGGTGVASLTAYGLILGGTTTTGAVQTLANGTSGFYLKSNGASALPSWESTSGLSPFTRGVMPGVNSLNLIYQVTQADSAVFGVLASGTPLAKYHHVGTGYFSGAVGINQAPATSAAYELQVNGDILSNTLRVNTNMSLGTFGDPAAGVALTLQGQGAATGGAINVLQVEGTNSTDYSTMLLQANSSQSTAAGSHTGLDIRMSNNSDASGSHTSALYRGIHVNIATKSNSTTPVTLVTGYDFSTGVTNSRTQTFTTIYGYRSRGINNFSTGGLLTSGGTIRVIQLDSFNHLSYAGGTAYQIYAANNNAKTLYSVFETMTSIGTSATPTGFLMLGAGTTTLAPLVFTSGTDLTTGIDGAVNWDGSNLKVWDGTTKYTIDKSLTGSASLDFGSIASLGNAELTITVTGAADGDVVSLGIPNTAFTAGLVFTARVSSANTVSVQCYNSTGAPIDPTGATFKVRVIQ